ncbi:kelch repeat and BTB domain-containing protein 8-like [Branchiostoma floridae]|uniref:Kelch repeat and BTB domain-containing protein 8-like n=1 Tax=Branchiostoma floridae TaxID=7739 RepID=A0A9J7LXM7_BRAFL|nr:kelch repeat and BTB domain-containing protein 8-like [Branchiostoma floridae]
MFGEILSYIYSGTLHVSLDKVQPLYQAADLLQLDYVRDTCSKYMVKNMKVERSTCVDLYKFADVYSQDIVRSRCQQWIVRHFTEVASSEEFCSLSVHQLTEVISHDELDVKEETTVWEAVVRWVQHSKEDRQHHLPSILPHVRFNLLTSDDTAAILDHPLVREDPGSSEVIRNVVQKGNPTLKPRHGMFIEMAFLSHRDSDKFLFMNPHEGKYIKCRYEPGDLPEIQALTVTSDNDICILANELEDSRKLSLFKYSHVRNVWEPAGISSVSRWRRWENDMVEERLVEVDRTLYYLVENLEENVVRMRKYIRHRDMWMECSQLELDYCTYDFSAALSCNSHLYFITSTEVHRYDASQNCWCKLSSPEPPPDINTAVAMGTEIFWTDLDFNQIIVYDTESDQWQKLQGWQKPGNLDIGSRNYSHLFVMENQLHILLSCTTDKKGDWQRCTNSKDIEEDKYSLYLVYVYDRPADTWRQLKADLPNDITSYSGHIPHCLMPRIYPPYLKG